MSMIVYGEDGLYHVTVTIQDGIERVGSYATEDEAQAAWRQAEKTWNNNSYKPGTRLEVLYRVLHTVTSTLCRSQIENLVRDPECAIVLPPPLAHLASQDPTLVPGPTSGSAPQRRVRVERAVAAEDPYRGIRVQEPTG